MKIVLGTAIWGRDELTRIVLSYYKELSRYYDLELIAIGSEGDVSRSIAYDCGWDYIEHLNYPLTDKFNMLSRIAGDYDNMDAFMLIGSDDLVNRHVFNHYFKTYNRDTQHMLGFEKCYFYDACLNKLYDFNGYKIMNGSSIGAGRIFSRSVLEKADYQLWIPSDKNRGLDINCSKRLKELNIPEYAISSMSPEAVIIDVKTDENLNSITRISPKITEVDVKKAWQTFPIQMDSIRKLFKSQVTEFNYTNN